MPDLADGEATEMKGSGAKPYTIRNVGGVYSCSCPAWRNQSTPIERRSCKHIRKLRGDAAEEARIGGALPQKPVKATPEGEDAAGPPVLLAETWDNALDLSGWWMSEKLDGVRAYWDGRQFLSRQGNIYHAPDWFTAGLPDVPLDGELWVGRKAFQRTVGIVRRQDKTDLWKEVRFLVFDAPAAGGPFEDRMAFLRDGFRTWASEHRGLHEHALCESVEHLRAELARVEALGGEGLMIRQPGSKYEAGRSATLLKVKSFRDAEAVVVGHEPGKGKHAGRLGALTVRLPDGKVFSVGTGFSDKERAAPPPVGSTITFRYQELSDGGVPRFPSYVRVRTDVAPSPAAPAKAKKAAATEIETFRLVGDDPPAVAKPTAANPTGGDAMTITKRYFECTEGGASKFWEVWMEDATTVTTRWGKIGTDGQQKAKPFPTEEKAKKEYDKLVAEKTAKGYAEK
jgi:DNA ligase-1